MGPFESEGAVGRRSAGNSVLREEAERPIQPRFTPPLPAETVTLTGPHQMVPNLLFDPVSDVREAPVPRQNTIAGNSPRTLSKAAQILSLVATAEVVETAQSSDHDLAQH